MLKAVLAPFIGKYNINPENIEVIRKYIDAALTDKAQNTYTIRAGNQLVSWSALTDIIKIGQNVFHKDRIDVAVRLHVPYPLNYLDLTLIVGDTL
jgi:NAD dependent epimerase/dehydratase family enzyme